MFNEQIEFLKKISFLTCWNDAYLNNLLITSETIKIQKGKFLFQINDKADCFYLIKEGEFEFREQFNQSQDNNPDQNTEGAFKA